MISIAGLAAVAILYKGAKYIKNKFFKRSTEEIEIVLIQEEEPEVKVEDENKQ